MRRAWLIPVLLLCFAEPKANAWQAITGAESRDNKPTSPVPNVAPESSRTTLPDPMVPEMPIAGGADLETKLSKQIDEKIEKAKVEILAAIKQMLTDAKNTPPQIPSDLGSPDAITGEFDIPSNGLDGLISRLKCQGWLIVRFIPGKPDKLLAVLPKMADRCPVGSSVPTSVPSIQTAVICPLSSTVVPYCYSQPYVIQPTKPKLGWLCH